MILYEYEGKKLLSDAGINIPKSQLIDSLTTLQNNEAEILKQAARIAEPRLRRVQDGRRVVIKAQVLSGKRADAGGILMVNELSAVSSQLIDMFGKKINGEKVEKILIEEKVDIEKEYYLSISYDTDYRSLVLSISKSGGTGIESRGVDLYPIDILEPSKNLPQTLPQELIKKLIELFLSSDCLLLEINPLVQTKSGEWVALDAKIKLDDEARGRHEWDFTPRSVPGYQPTPNEIEAKKIDEGDHRGTAGSTYFDLPGDIAVLASGGGGSLTAMDALLKAGGKPANYTEYSGNPPKEKVEKLTKIVLSKPNLTALWVVGAIANLTDIYETVTGFIEGLRALRSTGVKIDFPIVIRRAGPRDKEAFELLKEQIKDFDIQLYGTEISITKSAEIVAEQAKKFKEQAHV